MQQENHEGERDRRLPFSLHPLHTWAMVERANSIVPGGYQAVRENQTGRTTAIALRAIAEAISNPGREVAIIDHSDCPDSDRHLARNIERMIQRLELRALAVQRVLIPRRAYVLVFGVLADE
ncbi:hypothetical protein D9M69_527380 [compost metagenome]